MLNRPFVRILPAALCAVALVASCSDPKSQVPTTPSGPAFLSAEIVGPAGVPPGQSAQYTANARFSDGTVKAVAGSAVRWQSSNSTILTVNSSGLASATQTRGELTLQADITVNGVRRTVGRTLTVIPDGTFRVTGVVLDREISNPSAPVVGARVEVATGDPATLTDNNGQYRLYGVPPTADIRVSAAGYAPDTRTVSLNANSTQNFQLSVNGPRTMFSGNYTVAVDADSCSGSPVLPGFLRHRTYDAVVTQSGLTVDVQLIEPRFRLNSIGRGNRFSGVALVGGVRFTLGYYDSYYYPYYGPESYPNLVEVVGNGTFMNTSGIATLTGTPASASGTLQGSMYQWDSRFPASGTRLLGLCSSGVRLSLTQK